VNLFLLISPLILLARLFVLELVGLTGFEPVTLRLSSACSNQLSYRPNLIADFGARGAEESRTPDL
jgi:hypothetical protein